MLFPFPRILIIFSCHFDTRTPRDSLLGKMLSAGKYLQTQASTGRVLLLLQGAAPKADIKLSQWFSQLIKHQNRPGALMKTLLCRHRSSDLIDYGQGARICISNKFSSAANVNGLRITFLFSFLLTSLKPFYLGIISNLKKSCKKNKNHRIPLTQMGTTFSEPLS